MKFRNPILRLFSTSSSSPPTHQSSNNLVAVESAKKLHAHLIRKGAHTDPTAIADVLRSYALSTTKPHKILSLFDHIERPTIFVWNWTIKGLSLGERPSEAISVYNRMRHCGVCANKLTFIFVLKACARVPDIVHGWKVHVHCMKLGFESYLFVSNSLISMYGSCGEVGFAQKMFDGMHFRDLVSWNSLICGYSQVNKFREVKADAVTMVKVVLACSHLNDQEFVDHVVNYIEENGVKMDVFLANTLIDLYGRCGSVGLARNVFDHMDERNLVSWNAMIEGYVKAGDLVAAQELFESMPLRDVISWSSMIRGYSQTKQFSNALTLFREMMTAKVKPDEITLTSVLPACGHLGSLDVGKAIHEYIHEHKIKQDIHVGNSLIDMYCKCGCIEKALEVFREMKSKDTVSWTSIISGLAVNGYAIYALKFFSQMLSGGVPPSHVTFIGVLQACTHTGLVDEGFGYFVSMTKIHGIEPRMKHFGCMVDLLSRSGNLDRAYEFIKKMPVAPDATVWRILLSACKLHGNIAMAEIAMDKLLESDPSNSGNYVLLSNTYAGADRWDEAMNVRELMKECDVQKPPGCSSIEVNNGKHEPLTPDKLHFLSKEQVLTG
uniref:Uncharacterized protein n=1 Tax=Nelumbo nucifera TaxID=4432 RepID=A0A822Y8S4_NELNU|nr:TPA_asm: hypothetical protein HUJ06_028903 [Nelumbo nucifera]